MILIPILHLTLTPHLHLTLTPHPSPSPSPSPLTPHPSTLALTPRPRHSPLALQVLVSEDMARFERALFRSSRGNCLVRFAEIEQPVTDPVSEGGREWLTTYYTIRLAARGSRLMAHGSQLTPSHHTIPKPHHHHHRRHLFPISHPNPPHLARPPNQTIGFRSVAR